MVTQVNIDALKKLNGVHWITALKSVSIRKLVKWGAVPLARFDEVNLFEMVHPDCLKERLVACRNRQLEEQRARPRDTLLNRT